jgi:hypothetical protein
LALALFACGIFATLPQELLQDGWLVLVGGRAIVTHGLPHYNTLTIWDHGKAWVDQQWLGQLFFYGLYLLGGLKIMVLAGALLCVSALAGATFCALRLGASAKATTAVLLPTILTMTYFDTTRTQLLAFPLFICVVYLLIRDSQQPSTRVLWVLPILVVWANLHGSVLLAAGLVALRGLTLLVTREGRAHARGRACLLVLAPLCVLVSPYGWNVVSYYHATIGNPEFAHAITEWAPTTLSATTVGFYVLLLLAALLMGRPAKSNWFERLALLSTGVFALMALRNTVWFVLLALVMLPRLLTLSDNVNGVSPRLRRAVVVFALMGAAALFLVAAIKPLKPTSLYESDYTSHLAAAVAQSAATHSHAPVFASGIYADYLLWQDPQLIGRVVYDIRDELLSTQQIKEALLVDNGEDALSVLGVGTIIVLPRNMYTQQIVGTSNWQVTYRDSKAVVAIRRR